MRFDRMITAVESHTAGEPTRVVVGGIPHIPGRTMMEKREYFQNHLEHIRKALMHEPRGHKDMAGAIITAPVSEGASFGVLFISGTTYEYMCGHGSIGVATVAVETGMVTPVEPVTKVTFDTPAGMVTGYVNVNNGTVRSVTIRNVPAFLYKSTSIDIPNAGSVPVDIAFGGNFFPIVDARNIGVKVEPKNILELRRIGTTVRRAVSEKVRIEHPENPRINEILDVRIYDKPVTPGAHARVVVITGDGEQVDRSPCGTGTCAHMAMLYSKGQLRLNEESVHESIIGTIFKGKLIGTTNVGDYQAVVPEITGSAYITGISNFTIDPNDPLKYGFSL